jgi:hypothetical protein
MSNSCRPIFPATAYAGDDPIKMEFAKLYRPHSTDHKPGMKATDLIVLNQTPSYTGPRTTTEFLESRYVSGEDTLDGWMSDSERRRRRKAEGLEETDGEGTTDETIIEELAIASFMVPEVLHDDDYEWGELYDATPGIPFHTTQGERDLREQITKVHFPSEQEIEECMGITDEDIRRGDWVSGLCLWFGSRADLEWEECLDLSYFIEIDQSTDEEFFIVDNKGRPALHNAERHEQRCALNALWNHPELDLKVKSTISSLDGRGFTQVQEVMEKTNVLDECGIHAVECQLIATGDNFAAAVCRYGGIFVPRKYQSLIGDGGDFTARLTISTEGAKYPLRVAEINRC